MRDGSRGPTSPRYRKIAGDCTEALQRVQPSPRQWRFPYRHGRVSSMQCYTKWKGSSRMGQAGVAGDVEACRQDKGVRSCAQYRHERRQYPPIVARRGMCVFVYSVPPRCVISSWYSRCGARRYREIRAARACARAQCVCAQHRTARCRRGKIARSSDDARNRQRRAARGANAHAARARRARAASAAYERYCALFAREAICGRDG